MQKLEMEFPDGSDPSKHQFPPGSELPRGLEHLYTPLLSNTQILQKTFFVLLPMKYCDVLHHLLDSHGMCLSQFQLGTFPGQPPWIRSKKLPGESGFDNGRDFVENSNYAKRHINVCSGGDLCSPFLTIFLRHPV